tara:strand:+ start:487 stop:642 length:156 start_codon:yes stop_codon:yes gene_type:complete
MYGSRSRMANKPKPKPVPKTTPKPKSNGLTEKQKKNLPPALQKAIMAKRGK